MEKETIVFNGITFVRYPQARTRHQRVYYWPFDEKGKRAFDIDALHREIWKAHHGPIPKGHDIHHIDNNPLNNAIDNLECLPPKDHAARHKDQFHEQRQQHAEKMRLLAKEWHASPEGIEWHRKHGKESWANRQPVQRTCAQCGKEYMSLAKTGTEKFCSRLCISRWNEQNKVYFEDRQCIACGKTFSARKSRSQQVCSRKCSWIARKGS